MVDSLARLGRGHLQRAQRRRGPRHPSYHRRWTHLERSESWLHLGLAGCLSAPDQNTAIACGASVAGGRVVLRTTDAGKTWTNISIGYSDYGKAVAFADADHGWVSAADSQGFCMLATTDGGKTWT